MIWYPRRKKVAKGKEESTVRRDANRTQMAKYFHIDFPPSVPMQRRIVWLCIVLRHGARQNKIDQPRQQVPSRLDLPTPLNQARLGVNRAECFVVKRAGK